MKMKKKTKNKKKHLHNWRNIFVGERREFQTHSNTTTTTKIRNSTGHTSFSRYMATLYDHVWVFDSGIQFDMIPLSNGRVAGPTIKHWIVIWIFAGDITPMRTLQHTTFKVYSPFVWVCVYSGHGRANMFVFAFCFRWAVDFRRLHLFYTGGVWVPCFFCVFVLRAFIPPPPLHPPPLQNTTWIRIKTCSLNFFHFSLYFKFTGGARFYIEYCIAYNILRWCIE